MAEHLDDKTLLEQFKEPSTKESGYTRIIKLGARPGDNAETAMIELVDFNEIYGKGKGEAKVAAKKTRRSAGAKKKAEAADAPATEEKAAE